MGDGPKMVVDVECPVTGDLALAEMSEARDSPAAGKILGASLGVSEVQPFLSLFLVWRVVPVLRSRGRQFPG